MRATTLVRRIIVTWVEIVAKMVRAMVRMVVSIIRRSRLLGALRPFFLVRTLREEVLVELCLSGLEDDVFRRAHEYPAMVKIAQVSHHFRLRIQLVLPGIRWYVDVCATTENA